MEKFIVSPVNKMGHPTEVLNSLKSLSDLLDWFKYNFITFLLKYALMRPKFIKNIQRDICGFLEVAFLQIV